MRVVMMSNCSGPILSIFCDLWREIQRRYCRLYLGIKIYRQSTRIIVGAHVAHSLLWNTLTILHVPVFHLLNFNSSFLYPYKDSQTNPCRKANSYLAVIAQQNESHHLLITSFSSGIRHNRCPKLYRENEGRKGHNTSVNGRNKPIY